MESDKYICVRTDGVNGAPGELSIVELGADGNNIIKRPGAVENAIMNPREKVIALRGQGQLQIVHIELKARLKQYKLPEGVAVQFWTWISPKEIAIVTATSVLHWSMDGDGQPVKVFDRLASVTGQIINYQVCAPRVCVCLYVCVCTCVCVCVCSCLYA